MFFTDNMRTLLQPFCCGLSPQEEVLRMPPPPPLAQPLCFHELSAERKEIYESTLRECKSVPQTEEDCNAHSLQFRIEGSDKLFRVLSLIGNGVQGYVYSTSSPSLVVKYGKVCNDKAVMEALKDIHGGEEDENPVIPKSYKITTPLSDYCRSRIVVMDRIGDEDWVDLMSMKALLVPLDLGYLRISRLLSAVKNFHSLGFIHDDLHRRNIRVKNSDPNFIGFVDLGLAKPFDPSSHTIGAILMKDLEYTVKNIQLYISNRPTDQNADLIMDGLELFWTARSVDSCPNYDLWIWVFEVLAQSPNDHLTANHLKNFLVPQFIGSFNSVIESRIAKGLISESEYVQVVRYPRSFPLPVPEFFSVSRIYPQMFPRVVAMLHEQHMHDMDFPDTRPYLALDSELIYVGDARNRLHSQIIENGYYYSTARNSVKYDIPNYRLEYRVNCDNLGDDLLLMQREFGMLKIGTQLGIGLKAIWMSPPVKLPLWWSSKVPFRLSGEEYKACAENPRSHVRYMVTEDWGTSLWKADKKFENLKFHERVFLGLKFAITYVKHFKHLHKQHGIVYGQMNPKNVLVEENRQHREYALKLDNFGLSFFDKEFDPDCADCSIRPNPFPDADPCFHTHWNIDGSRLAYRDDIYNVLLVAAWIMSIREKNFCILTQEDNPTLSISAHVSESIKKWKQDELIFEDIVDNYPESDRQKLRHHLQQALAKARSVKSVEDQPDYSSISDSLKNALKIAQKHAYP